MQKRTCVVQALGADTVARMEKPLAAGRSTLERAKPSDDAAVGYDEWSQLREILMPRFRHKPSWTSSDSL
jgi:hypothetical protein